MTPIFSPDFVVYEDKDARGHLGNRLPSFASPLHRRACNPIWASPTYRPVHLRNQRRNRIDHDDAERSGANEGLGNFQRLLTVFRPVDTQRRFTLTSSASAYFGLNRRVPCRRRLLLRRYRGAAQ